MGYTYGNQRTPNGSVNEVFALDIMRASPLNPAYNDDGSLALPDSYSLSYTGQVQSGNSLGWTFILMRYIKLVMILLALLIWTGIFCQDFI